LSFARNSAFAGSPARSLFSAASIFVSDKSAKSVSH
jgi:hypothetical protein